MAVVTRGRVVPQVDATGATRLDVAGASGAVGAGATATGADGATTAIDAPRFGRAIDREVVDAHAEAARIVERAHAEAERIAARAREGAEASIRDAADDARARAAAELSAGFVALRAREEARAERDLERVTGLAVLLAERVVQGAIEADPVRLAAMTRAALAEVRGARRAVIELHPLDADVVRGHLDGAGLPPEAIELRPAPELARGDLRVHTDLGTLDARLTVQLERLAAALQDALRG